MMKVFSFIYFFLAITTFSQSNIPIDSADYNVVCLHPTERYIAAMGNLSGVVQHGAWIYFDENGKVLSKGIYKNGKRHGKWFFYDIDEQLMESGSYKNGMKEGLWVVYKDMYVLFENGLVKDQNVFK